jgi:thiol-disulfide isomerase/thioredoxin
MKEVSAMIRRFPVLALILIAGFAVARADDAPALNTRGPEPRTVSLGGQELKLADYAVPGKTTIFDFYSEFCPPCRAIAPLVKKLHEARADLAVVEIDINRPGLKAIDWESPIAKEFQLDSIPHFKVFGPDGKLLAEGDDARTLVMSWVQNSVSF